jgi:hypothetical protein
VTSAQIVADEPLHHLRLSVIETTEVASSQMEHYFAISAGDDPHDCKVLDQADLCLSEIVVHPVDVSRVQKGFEFKQLSEKTQYFDPANFAAIHICRIHLKAEVMDPTHCPNPGTEQLLHADFGTGRRGGQITNQTEAHLTPVTAR